MGDFLFSFTGRKKVLGYWLSIICAVLAAAGVAQLQQLLGDWKFANIFWVTAAVIPAVLYLSATVRRFNDRGRHPLLGFVFYYIAPVAIVFGAQQILGTPIVNPETIATEVEQLPQVTEWTQPLVIKWGALGAAALLFLWGQITLFLIPGTKGENAFDAEHSNGLTA